MHLDPTETLAFYVIAILVFFTVIAAIADYSAMKADRKARDKARAEARAKRMEGADQSEDSSWQEPSRV